MADQSRVPPHDPAAEQAVLGGILLDNSALDRVSLAPEDFHERRHGLIFRTMQRMIAAGTPIDEVTLSDALKAHDELQEIGGATYLAELEDLTPSAANISSYARIVREKANARSLIALAGDIYQRAHEGEAVTPLLESLQHQVRELKANATSTSPLGASRSSVSQLTSAADLLALPDTAARWVVDGFLGEGCLSLLAGKPGAGKTTLARDLALRTAQGGTWLGRTVKQGTVLYLALEEHERQVKKHMVKMGITAEDSLHFFIGGIPPGKGMDILAHFVERVQPVFVVIDPLDAFLQVRKINEYGEVYAALRPLVRFVRDTDLHILLVHHAGKGEGSPEDAYLGSTALSGAVDTNMLLEVSDGRRSLRTTKQREGDILEPTIMTLHPETGRVQMQETKAEAVKQDMEAQFVDYLRDHGEAMDRGSLLDVVKGDTTAKSAALKSAVEKGLIQKKREGHKNVYWVDSTRHQNHDSETIANHVAGQIGTACDETTEHLVLGCLHSAHRDNGSGSSEINS